MSRASDYAAAVTSATDTAKAARPVSFVGSVVLAEVTDQGELRLTLVGTPQGAEALLLRDWLSATFG